LVVVFLNATLAYRNWHQIECEVIGNENWTHAGPQRTCYLKVNTTINSPGKTIGRKETVPGLSFWFNKKIFYLPINVSESFPNLVVYGANGCSVKTISKVNFRGLKKLIRLDLGYNEIAFIPDDTFEDLKALEWLQIGETFLILSGADVSLIFSLKHQTK
jgi:hypothetical protein